MTIFNRLRARAQQSSSSHTQSSRIQRLIALVAAWLLIGASAAIGVTFGFNLGSQYHVALGVVFALASLGGEILKPFAVLGCIQAFRRVNLTQFATCTVLGLVCITYSLAADLSISATVRGDLAAERGSKIERMETLKASRSRALSALESLPQVEVRHSLSANIVRLQSTPGAECAADPKSKAYGKISRRVCPRLAQLKTDLAVAQRRTDLQRQIERVDSLIVASDEGTVVKHADPLAASLASYAGALGWTWKADAVSPWLALLLPLFIEFGSSLGLVVAASIGHVPHEVVRVGDQGGQSPENRDFDSHEGARAQVVKFLQRTGGRASGGQRGLAALIGTSRTRFQQVIAELEREGRLLVNTTRAGTQLRLVTV